MSPRRRNSYVSSGVDDAAAASAIAAFKDKVRSTFRPEVVGDLGHFGGMFAFDPSRYVDPILVSSADGPGTKTILAAKAGVHHPLGVDLVAHCTNDVAAMGAEPLFFLDYIAIEKIDPAIIEELVAGMSDACRQVRCALIGGEIAEHPGQFAKGSYDLAGFCVGAVERSSVVDGSEIAEGDVVLGIESSGLHCNGFSLVRKVLGDTSLSNRPEALGGRSLGEEMLIPTAIYSPAVVGLVSELTVNGLANVTGGGIPGNLSRVIPEGLHARIEGSSWEVPAVFGLVQSMGRIEQSEMFSTFNMGMGMLAVVPEVDSNPALDFIRSHGHRAHEIGTILPAGTSDDPVVIK